MENENQVDISFVEAAKEIWASVHPDIPYSEEDIAEIAEKIEGLYPQCTVEMSIVEFGILTDNARALFVTPLMDGAPEQTFTVFYPDANRFMFVHQESGMPVEMSSAECLSIPTQYLTAVIGAEQMAFVEAALRGDVEPSDPVAEQMRVMVEAQRQQAVHDGELKHIALNLEPALEGSNAPADNDNISPELNDYISFEQYLEVMRKMHSYEQMPGDHRVQFDHAVAYRWRDIKALKFILASVEGNDGVNALGRYNGELVRLSMVNDQTYLELAHMRNAMCAEAKAFRELAATHRKRNKMVSLALEAFANRVDSTLELLGPLPPEAVDMLTRLSNMLNEKVAECTALRGDTIALAKEVERLRGVLQEEGDYCHGHATSLTDTDPERAERHRERGDRLIAGMYPKEEELIVNDNHAHVTNDDVSDENIENE